MYNKEIVVRCESGLHNKQATYFVQKANEFESLIYLECGNRKMNAKSLLGIMSLGVITGTTVVLSAIGPDAEAAVSAVVVQYAKHFNVKSRNMTDTTLDLVLELRTEQGSMLVRDITRLTNVISASLIAHDGEVTF